MSKTLVRTISEKEATIALHRLVLSVESELLQEIELHCQGFPAGPIYENFATELQQKLTNYVGQIIRNNLDRFNSQPSAVRYGSIYNLLTIAVYFKSELLKTSYCQLTYDYETDIEGHKKRIQKKLHENFELEFKVWQLCERNQLRECLPIIEQLEEKRRQADISLKNEVIHWRCNISMDLRDIDIFFGAIRYILNCQSDDFAYNLAYVKDTVIYFLKLYFPYIGVIFTKEKIREAAAFGDFQQYAQEQYRKFINFMADKIIPDIFDHDTIKSRSDFEAFFKKQRASLIKEYQDLYPDTQGMLLQ